MCSLKYCIPKAIKSNLLTAALTFKIVFGWPDAIVFGQIKTKQKKQNKTLGRILWVNYFFKNENHTKQKTTHFLKDFVDLWLGGLWSIISKEDVLVDFAGCFFSFHGRLSVLLTPSASVWSLALFQLHNTVKPAKTKKHWGVNGRPWLFSTH